MANNMWADMGTAQQNAQQLQDSYNQQIKDAQNAYNEQIKQAQAQWENYQKEIADAWKQYDNQIPSSSYDTTGVNGNNWVSDPSSNNQSDPFVHATTGDNTQNPGYNPTQQQQNNPGYIDPAVYNVGPYVNPFNNDAQINAIINYYNQLGDTIAAWGDQALKAIEDNAELLVNTPGGMDAAKAAIENTISGALDQLKNTVNNGVNQIINSTTPGSSWTQNISDTFAPPTIDTSGLDLPGIDLPGLDLPGLVLPGTGDTTVAEDAPVTTSIGTGSPSPYNLPDLPGPNPERVNHVDTTDIRNMLQQLVDLQTQQSDNRINYAVQQGVNDLNRAMEDAAKNYQTQRNQVAADEANALDNQALYAEARGDRGGIGAAQYASIQNTAAQNRRAVNDAQVKLGTDTARQIADLRAQGEFEKADQLLSIAQSHMSQLANLEQWALGTNVGVDEFNSQLQQWVDEYNLDKQKFLSDLELSAAQLTGMFSDGTRTYEAEQALISSLVNSGNALLQMGVMPSKQQLQAMGMTETQARQYVAKKTSPLGVLGLI